MTTENPVSAPRASRKRLVLARAFVIIGVVLGTISLASGYLRWQVFDSGTFEETAAQLLASEPIRQQVAGTLVDQLYANIDVQAELEAQLPAEQQGLAAPLAAALRSLGERTAYQLLGRPRVQALFVAAATNARQQADNALSDKLGPVETQNGVIVLNLHEAVIALGSQLSFLGELEGRLPENAGVIEIARADKFETAQELTSLFRSGAAILPFLALAFAAAGIALARGRRRLELRAFAIGAIVGGVLLLVVRNVAGGFVVDSLATSTAVEPATQDAWDVLTELLASGAWTAVILGIGGLFGVWLSAPEGSGAAARHALAPVFARRPLGYSVVFGGYLLLLLWQPTAQFGRLQPIVVFGLLLVIGYEALRRLVLTEEPEASTASAGGRLRELLPGRGQPAPSTGSDRASQLATITRLHETGVLDEAGFAAAKARLLQ